MVRVLPRTDRHWMASSSTARCVDGAGRSICCGWRKRSRLGWRSARSGEGTEEEQAMCNIWYASPVQYSLGAGPEVRGLRFLGRYQGDGGEEQAR